MFHFMAQNFLLLLKLGSVLWQVFADILHKHK